jgi:hypothetical protein
MARLEHPLVDRCRTITVAPALTHRRQPKAPYIRESRRIRAVTTVTEHDVALATAGAEGIARYQDSIGVGSYRIDLHPQPAATTTSTWAASPSRSPSARCCPSASAIS